MNTPENPEDGSSNFDANLDTIRAYVPSVNPTIGEEKMKDFITEFWPVQPEPGSVMDQLLKKSEARGEARGYIKTIRILESILGETESPEEAFDGLGLADLEAMIEALRKKVTSRPTNL